MFLYWLLLPVVLADDGCWHQTDWKCGDACIKHYAKCKCGNQTFGVRDGKWCCNDNSCMRGEERKHKECPFPSIPDYCDSQIVKDGICLDGNTLPLTATCRKVCNYHPQDDDRGLDTQRSHIPCEDSKQCVQESKVCRGEAICLDKSDLKWCKQPKRAEEKCPFDHYWCDKTMGLPGQCIHSQQVSDRQYNCLDRSDENPFSRNNPPLNLTRLKQCISQDSTSQDLGFICSGHSTSDHCLPLRFWCASHTASKCEELGWIDPVNGTWVGGQPSNHPDLCKDYTFWNSQPCDPAERKRCTGRKSGECGSCEDKSDRFRPAIEENPCSTSKEFQCFKNGNLMYLDINLKCDMHPQCDNGQDELNCKETYKNRGFISASASYKFESIHHNKNSTTPSVMIWATPCDGIVECFEDWDEWYCDIDWIMYTAIGKLLNLIMNRV